MSQIGNFITLLQVRSLFFIGLTVSERPQERTNLVNAV